jgi:uncharacterized protein (UPF0335 family)
MAKAATATNGFDQEQVIRVLNKIDGFKDDLLSERGGYMQTCRGIRESIAAVYDEAKALGIPKKELRTLVKIRENEQKNQKLFDELEADQQATLQMLAAAEQVKDLPLWRAAAAAPKEAPRPGVQ